MMKRTAALALAVLAAGSLHAVENAVTKPMLQSSSFTLNIQGTWQWKGGTCPPASTSCDAAAEARQAWVCTDAGNRGVVYTCPAGDGWVKNDVGAGGGGSSAFDAITTGTNTTATMTVSSGALLIPSGTGVVRASDVNCTNCITASEITSTTAVPSSFSFGLDDLATGSAAADSVASVDSAGTSVAWRLFGAGPYWITTGYQGSGTAAVAADNCIEYRAPLALTQRGLTTFRWYVSSANAGAVCSIGIYSESGGTLHTYCQAVACGTSGQKSCTVTGASNLDPDLYVVRACADVAAVNYYGISGFVNNKGSGSVTCTDCGTTLPSTITPTTGAGTANLPVIIASD